MNHCFTRRQLLTALGIGTASLADCVDDKSIEAGEESTPDTDIDTPTPDQNDHWNHKGDDDPSDIPTREPTVLLDADIDDFTAAAHSVMPPDGILSIDDPVFEDTDYGDTVMDPGDPILASSTERPEPTHSTS